MLFCIVASYLFVPTTLAQEREGFSPIQFRIRTIELLQPGKNVITLVNDSDFDIQYCAALRPAAAGGLTSFPVAFRILRPAKVSLAAGELKFDFEKEWETLLPLGAYAPTRVATLLPHSGTAASISFPYDGEYRLQMNYVVGTDKRNPCLDFTRSRTAELDVSVRFEPF